MKIQGIFGWANLEADVTDVSRTGNVFRFNVILEPLSGFIGVWTFKALPIPIRPLLHLLRYHGLQRT